jgi:hypothetical protein
MSKCNGSSQKPLLTTGIRTQDLWFCSLNLRPRDQPAVKFAVVSTDQSALDPRGGLWPVLLMCDP